VRSVGYRLVFRSIAAMRPRVSRVHMLRVNHEFAPTGIPILKRTLKTVLHHFRVVERPSASSEDHFPRPIARSQTVSKNLLVLNPATVRASVRPMHDRQYVLALERQGGRAQVACHTNGTRGFRCSAVWSWRHGRDYGFSRRRYVRIFYRCQRSGTLRSARSTRKIVSGQCLK